MERLPDFRRIVLLGAVLAALLVAPAAASPNHTRTSLLGDVTAALEVDTGSPLSPLSFQVATAAAVGLPARIELDVPAGYALDLTAKPGVDIGFVTISITDSGQGAGGGFAFAALNLAVGDPAAYAADQIAQACAPGAHAAVWSGTAAIAGQAVRLLVFVDPVAAGGDTLFICLSGLTGTGAISTDLGFDVAVPMSSPQASGTYVWRSLVTPRSGNAYEMRAVATLPASLTLKAAYDAKRRRAVLSGRLTAAGRPQGGQDISLTVQVGSTGSSDSRVDATTAANGRYSIHRPIKQTTDYVVYVSPQPQRCTSPSIVAGGCLSETPIAPAPAFATAFVPRHGDAMRAYTPAGQTLAGRELLDLRDLPAGFSPVAPAIHDCENRHPSETRLTVTGEAQSPLYLAIAGAGSLVDPTTFDVLEVVTSTRVYRSQPQAKAALAGEATLAHARCLLQNNPGVATKTTRSFPQHPARVLAFRDVVKESGQEVTLELMFIQRGRSVASLIVAGAGMPTRTLALDLTKKVAGRLR